MERRAWSRKEDDAIIRLVNKFGTKRWAQIAQDLNAEVRPRAPSTAALTHALGRRRQPLWEAVPDAVAEPPGPGDQEGAVVAGRGEDHLRGAAEAREQVG